jgi:DNA-directed RNA polymerase subunit RPC12/RpoP
MTDSQATVLHCTQCGGELEPDQGQIFVTCPYCTATVFIDKSQVVFHWALSPTLDATQAEAALRRWMSGSSTVKDLDVKARISGHTFSYFPLWYFRLADSNKETTALEPAAATSVTELRRLALPAGDLRRYDSSLDAQAEPPSVPLEAALGWLRQEHGRVDVRETSLVHVPIYIFKYIYRNQTYTAVVEAATGVVLANLYPAKDQAPYLLAGCSTALVYLALAVLPLTGLIFFAEPGGLLGFAVALALGVLAAPFLFAFAAWVAAKV